MPTPARKQADMRKIATMLLPLRDPSIPVPLVHGTPSHSYSTTSHPAPTPAPEPVSPGVRKDDTVSIDFPVVSPRTYDEPVVTRKKLWSYYRKSCSFLVPSTCSSVNYLPLSVAQESSRSSSVPPSSCSGSVCIRNVSSALHYLPATSRRSTLHRQAPNPKNAIGREEYIGTWHECVHDLLTQIVAIFLERPSAIFPKNIYRYTHSWLPVPHNCFHAY